MVHGGAWGILHGIAALKCRTGRGSGLSGYASISKVSLFLLSGTYIAFHYKKCFLWSRKLLKNQKSLMWKIQSYSANITCVLYFSGLYISLFLTNEIHSSPISLFSVFLSMMRQEGMWERLRFVTVQLQEREASISGSLSGHVKQSLLLTHRGHAI
uniref:Uncharacterized protein n=1 Tax=Myotis myotis TaxID=51298 RepID=A0A7J7XH55_MYOMY|nr:hypothetical protein mMyoMyo1_011624 [Myotis myotis]